VTELPFELNHHKPQQIQIQIQMPHDNCSTWTTDKH
jgi:hypothetical protein